MNFKYSEVDTEDYQNPVCDEKVLFTKEMFYKFQRNLVRFYIKRLTEFLTTVSPRCNSTCAMQNFKSLLIFEEKQEMLKFYKILLVNIK